MTRVWLTIIAIVEAVIAVLGLSAVLNIYLAHSAEMATLFLPILGIAVLLLMASAAIFIRRPWSYYLHIGVIILAAVVFLFYAGILVGRRHLVFGDHRPTPGRPVTIIFLLRPVRRYFGLGV